MAHTVQVTIDCADPDALAHFWAEALGYHIPPPPGDFGTWQEFLTDRGVPESEWNDASAVEDPDGAGPRIFFERVPEPKTVKNRVHLDVNVGGPRGTPPEERRQRVDAEAERLTGLGAREIGRFEKYGERWIVMADPEGNEFCLQ